MRFAAILASSFALLLAVAWMINSPAYDSAVACAAAVTALLSSFFLKPVCVKLLVASCQAAAWVFRDSGFRSGLRNTAWGRRQLRTPRVHRPGLRALAAS